MQSEKGCDVKPYYETDLGKLYCGNVFDVLPQLESDIVQCCVTSPPYWGLRDYGVEGQLGLEKSPDEYIKNMTNVFATVNNAMRKDGTLWLNVGDTYGGSGNSQQGKHGYKDGRTNRSKRLHLAYHDDEIKPKDLVGIPWMLAFALRAHGWWLRQEIIWNKINPMTESVKDRCTRTHESIFLLSKHSRYYFDYVAIQEPCSPNTHARGNGINPKAKHNESGVKQNISYQRSTLGLITHRNKRSIWEIQTQPNTEAHFATFPEKLAEQCIFAGTSAKGCCYQCGKPYVRIVEKIRIPTRPGNNSKIYIDPKNSPYKKHSGSIIGNRDPERHITQIITIGWEKQCQHYFEPEPCVVLDPFMGSGTVAAVCEKLGRRWIGIELSEQYCEIAAKRIEQARKQTIIPEFLSTT